MVKVKDVSLKIETASSVDKLKVTVAYKLDFDTVETGNNYKVRIELFGEDKRGDDEPATIFSSLPLTAFTFGSWLIQPQYTIVTAIAGEQSFVESREIPKQTLNEDPGVTVIKPDINTTIQIPHKDEVYALVSAAVEARSSTVNLLI